MNNRNDLIQIKRFIDDQQGAIGYVLAWLLGVPATLLVIIFILRGFN
jgi:hypothetical protein